MTDDAEINDVMKFIVKDSGTDSMDICVAAAGVLGTYDALVSSLARHREVNRITDRLHDHRTTRSRTSNGYVEQSYLARGGTSVSDQLLLQIFDVNTTGVFLTARAAARQMHAQKNVQGSIILIASMSGSIVNRDHHWVAYNASKSAVLQMGRNLAAEWGSKGVSRLLHPFINRIGRCN